MEDWMAIQKFSIKHPHLIGCAFFLNVFTSPFPKGKGTASPKK